MKNKCFPTFSLSYRMLIGAGVGSALCKDGNPLAVHFVMFLPALIGQGTIEQQAEWVGRAWAGEIIGTYAQVKAVGLIC